jgi:hypothetical protein
MDGIVLVNYQRKKGVRLKKIPATREKMSLTEKMPACWTYSFKCENKIKKKKKVKVKKGSV